MTELGTRRITRRKVLVTAGALGALGALATPVVALAHDSDDEENHRYRWDIINVDFSTGTLTAGGVASARANDNSKITLTGMGTFRANSGDSQDVTGGGTWKTSDKNGNATGNGSYVVSRFVRFTLAPGTPPLPHDGIGVRADERAGLAILGIRFDDGSAGALLVSCHLNGSPDSMFEGVTATKGFVDYWNREAPPPPPGNANRTNFHVLR